jgi:hypothetical protein
MSVIVEYVRLRPAELAELRRLLAEAPDEAYGYAGDLAGQDADVAPDEVPRAIDTDKAWAGLEHLLDKLRPPVNVVRGGGPITDDVWGYDAPRLLAAEQVRSAAEFLDAISFEKLTEGFDANELTKAEVYPNIWDEIWTLEYLKEAYTTLVAFFCAAAEDGDSVLIWMS